MWVLDRCLITELRCGCMDLNQSSHRMQGGGGGGVKVRVSCAALMSSDPQPGRAYPCVCVCQRECVCVKKCVMDGALAGGCFRYVFDLE